MAISINGSSETQINDEVLPEPILVYRNMSAEELSKFVIGERILPNLDHDFSDVSTADSNSVYFSPEQLEYVDDEQHSSLELSLANAGKKISDFEERGNIWLCGGMYAKSIIVEFLTREIPKVRTGKYSGQYVKEYVYEEYSSEQFQIQRIYNVELGKIVFDAHDYTENESKNIALKCLSDKLKSEEYDYAKDLDDRRKSAQQLLKDYKDKLPKPR